MFLFDIIKNGGGIMNELEVIKSVSIMKFVNGIEPLVSQGKIIIQKYEKGETL